MSEHWRVWSEFRPAADIGDNRPAAPWIVVTLQRMCVADGVIEQLLHDLSETALTAEIGCPRLQCPISCQILVPIDWHPGSCESQDWAYFWVTKTLGGPGAGEERPRMIQVFLFPARG